MKKLNIMEGVGHPLRQNHIDYLQTAVTEGIQDAGRINIYDSKDSYIISGCEITNDGINFSITAGWFCFKGMPVKVDAHTTPSGIAAFRWVVKEVNDGALAYQDASLHYIYKNRRVVYEAEAAPVQDNSVAEADVFRMYNEKFADLTLQNNWEHEVALVSPNGELHNKVQVKRTGRRAVLQGIAKAGAGGATSIVATLAEKYRPPRTMLFSIMSTTGTAVDLLVENNGELKLMEAGTQLMGGTPTTYDAAANERICLDGVSWDV